jgi:hypothetical protein
LTALNNFDKISRPDMVARCWLHQTKPVWIVECFANIRRAHHFQAFKALGEVPEGLHPWECPSQRIGDARHGFKTLEDAAEAGEASC